MSDLFIEAIALENINEGDLVVVKDGQAYHHQEGCSMCEWPNIGRATNNARKGETVRLSRYLI